MLAIQAVAPCIDQIPVNKIVELENRFAPKCNAFRDTFATVAPEIAAQLEMVKNRQCIKIATPKKFKIDAWLHQLRRELRQLRVDTATGTLAAKYEIPAPCGSTLRRR
jgi:hypothetical protein